MTATWLEVPLPAGDVATIRSSANELRVEAETVLTQRLRFAHASAATLAGWVGQAANAFELTERVAEESLAIMATAYGDAATQLESYAIAWIDARDAASTAEWSINDAIESYVSGAHGVLGDTVHAVNGFLSGAAGLLDSVLPGDQSALTDFVDSLTSWSAPDERAAVRLIDPSANSLTMPTGILDAVQGAADWGVSHLLEGAGWVIDIVGDAISWALNALRDLEEALAQRITHALHHVHQAFDALVEMGAEVAARVADVAQDIGNAVWQATTHVLAEVGDLATWVRNECGDVLDEVTDVGTWIIDHLHDAASFGLALIALGLVLNPHRRREGRRLSIREQRDLDKAAASAFSDPKNQKYDDALREIAGKDVYERKQKYALPDGWHRLSEEELLAKGFDPDLLDGPADFTAAVYVTAAGSYVVAFRGTEPSHPTDWTEDLVNAGNLPSQQGLHAIRVAREAVRAFGDNGLEYTGHSLGGSLAAIASLATGHHATTFNAAGVGDGNYAAATLVGGSKADEGNIVNIYGTNDPLTLAQVILGLDQASGGQIALGSSMNIFGAHTASTIQWPEGGRFEPGKVPTS